MESRRQGQSKQETERQRKTERELGMTQKGWVRQEKVKERPMEPVRQVPLPMQSLFTLLLIYIFVGFLGWKFKVHFRFDRPYAYICGYATFHKQTTYA